MKCNIVVNIDYTKVIIDNKSDWCNAPSAVFSDVNSTVSVPLEYLDGADSSCIAASVGTIVGNSLVVAVGTEPVRVVLTNAKVQVNVESHVPYHITEITPTCQYVTPGQSAQVNLTYASGYTPNDLQATVGTVSNGTLSIPTKITDSRITTTLFRGSVETNDLGTTSSSTEYYLPMDNNYKYGISQQIYLSSELGNSGTIRSISFKKASNVETNRHITIYMENVTDSIISGFSTVANAQCVFDGKITFNHNDWTEIVLSRPFDYDNTKNLRVTVHDTTGSYSSSAQFIVYQRSGNSNREAIYCRRDGSTPYDISQITTYSGSSLVRKNSIKIYKMNEIEDEPDPEPVIEPTIIEITKLTDTDTETHYTSIPVSLSNKYSMSEQIYLASEIGQAGTISDIAFNLEEYANTTRLWDIYLVYTEMSQFPDNQMNGGDHRTDAVIHPTINDLVFAGPVTITNSGWISIHLDKQFVYDGVHNLCVIVYDKTGTQLSVSKYFKATKTPTERRLSIRKFASTDTNVSPLNTWYSDIVDLLWFRNHIRFYIIPEE